MKTWEEVVSYAKAVAENAGKKTGEFVETTKTKMEIADIERELAAIYEGLGRLVYDGKKSGESVDEMVDACVTHIDEQNAYLEQLRDKILENQSAVRCAACGAVNAEDASYCNKCGTKL